MFVKIVDMKYLLTLIVCTTILFTSCNSQIGTGNNGEQNQIHESEVLTILNQQESSWNEGDVEGFMQGYWNNDSLMFVSGEKVLYGWQKMTDNYKKTYSTKQLMGELSFKVHKTEVLSNDAVLVIGNWSIHREMTDFGGKFSLLWRKINGEWKIVIDHTS